MSMCTVLLWFVSLWLCNHSCRFMWFVYPNTWVLFQGHWPIIRLPIITSSNGNIFRVTVICVGNTPVTGEFPWQRDNNAEPWCFLVVSRNKLLNKHSIYQWFQTPWLSFDVAVMPNATEATQTDWSWIDPHQGTKNKHCTNWMHKYWGALAILASDFVLYGDKCILAIWWR